MIQIPYVEKNCVVEHEGKKFEAGGAFVSNSHIIAYPSKNGILNDWHGNPIGTYKVLSSRPAIFFGRHSWQGSTYYFMKGKIGDKFYLLRGFGNGMIATGKRTKN